MKPLKVFIALIIAYTSLKISILITNTLIHFEVGLGTWIINLFILSPIYLVVLLGISGAIGFGLWNILSYIIILSSIHTDNKNPSKNAATAPTKQKIKRPSVIGMLGKTLAGTVGMIGVAIIIIIIGLTSFAQFGNSLSKSNQKKFENKFDTAHQNTSYSDVKYDTKAAEVAVTDYRFIYYLKELNIASTDFVIASNIVDIFEADVKRELAIACMRDVLIEKVAATGFNTIEGYKMNALNAAGNKRMAIYNTKLIEKGRSLYNYPLSSGYGYYILNKDYGNRCNDTMSVDDMFDKYLPIYLKDKRTDADRARLSENKHRAKIATKIDNWIDEF